MLKIKFQIKVMDLIVLDDLDIRKEKKKTHKKYKVYMCKKMIYIGFFILIVQ